MERLGSGCSDARKFGEHLPGREIRDVRLRRDEVEEDAYTEGKRLKIEHVDAASEFGVRDRLVHMGVAQARDKGAQREWLARAAALHEARGTPLDLVCSVCLEDVREGPAPLFYTVCSHVFHRACLDKCCDPQQGGVMCPLCRSPVSVPTNTVDLLQEPAS